jgi:hypothetical protein
MPAHAHDAPVTVFSGLRAALVARLEAVDQAEAALARLHEAFGMPIAAPQGAVERVPVSPGPIAPDPASPALDAPAPGQVACEECGGLFPAQSRGQRKRYCGAVCRQRSHIRRRANKARNGSVPEVPPADVPFVI